MSCLCIHRKIFGFEIPTPIRGSLTARTLVVTLDESHLGVLPITRNMTCIVKAFTATGSDGGRCCYVEDQCNGATMKIASHITQLPRNNKTKDGTGIMRVSTRGSTGDRLELQDLRQHRIMALREVVSELQPRLCRGTYLHRNLLKRPRTSQGCQYNGDQVCSRAPT